MTDNEYIEHLIIKYLSEEATEEERHELKGLVESDKEVRKQFVDIRDIWNVSDSSEFDAAGAFTRFKKQIRSEEPKGKQRSIAWLKYAGIAASLIIMLMLGKYFSTVNEPTVQFYSYETKAGERKLLTLPDSSKVWMHANSVLTYSMGFNSTERKVTFKGEAFFDVAHNASLPFEVESGLHTITVLGTRFNVKANERVVETVLEDGKVQINVDSNNQQCQLLPGEKSEFDMHSKLLVKVKEPHMDVYTAIIKGQLVFKNEAFSKLAPRLEQWYGLTIKLDDDVRDLRFTGTIDNESIDDVLNIMAMSNNIKYTKTNDTISITKN
ncbi:FecR family protein [Carboxylicivirga sp. RSCT41]|uniref:FecR family protein n=1 Tax=Carboxylicivirga agarovorans TaxID=3417570 RepID=UPI003D32F235